MSLANECKFSWMLSGVEASLPYRDKLSQTKKGDFQ